MPNLRPCMALCLLACLSPVLGAGKAHAFSVPGCDALRDWAGTADGRDTGYSLAPRIGLPAWFAPAASSAVFGVAAADWSAQQVDAVQGALGECQRSAHKAKERDLAGVFKSAASSLRSLEKGHKAVEKARAAVKAHLAELGAVPASPELARAAGALAATDPGRPQAIRGLARELAGPVGGLLKALPDLPAADHQALVVELDRISGAAWDGVAAALDNGIAAAGDGVAGLLTLREVRLQALGNAAEPRIAERVERLDRLIGQRRTALGAVAGQWYPPACEALYAWSGAPDARERLMLGVQSSYRLFDAAASAPVFGKPVIDWSDDDLAAFATLRGQCAREWRLQLEAVPGRRPDQVGEDAPALLRAAGAGNWIDGADALVAQARERLQAHRAATAALAEAVAGAAALPAEPASLARLAELAALPAQQGLDGEARRAYQEAIRARRDELARVLVSEVIKGADALPVKTLADLPQLWAYGAESARRLADRDVLARLQPSWELAVTRHLDRLQPEFDRRLADMPVSLQGMMQSRDAVERLTGASGAYEQRAFGAYRLAADKRVRAIHDALKTRFCDAERDRLGLDGGDGSQRVWDGGQGLSLGEVACAMAAAGNPMSEYDGPGLFSRGQAFKTDVAGYGYHTVALHQAEVAPGSEMLLGHQLQDANGQRAITVQQWLGYLAQATRAPSRGDRRCDDPGLADAAEERPDAGLLALSCLVPPMQAGR